MFNASLEPLLQPFCQWHKGAWRSSTGPYFDVFNPASGQLLANVADQGAAVAEAAIARAHAALPGRPRVPRSARPCCAAGLSSSWSIRSRWLC